jgi:hypothetical protein
MVDYSKPYTRRAYRQRSSWLGYWLETLEAAGIIAAMLGAGLAVRAWFAWFGG